MRAAYAWLPGDESLIREMRKRVLRHAMAIVGAGQRLWDLLDGDKPVHYGDLDWSARRLTDEEANFNHPRNREYDEGTRKLIAELLKCPLSEVSLPDYQFRGLALRNAPQDEATTLIWWGKERNTPSIHIRLQEAGPADYRDHPLYYRDVRDVGYVLSAWRASLRVDVASLRVDDLTVHLDGEGWILDAMPPSLQLDILSYLRWSLQSHNVDVSEDDLADEGARLWSKENT